MSNNISKISLAQQLLNFSSSAEKTNEPNALAQELANRINESNLPADIDTQVFYKRGAEQIEVRFSKEGEVVQYNHKGPGNAVFNYDRLTEPSSPAAKYSWTDLNTSHQNTHVTFTVDKTTAKIAGGVGAALFAGPANLLLGTGVVGCTSMVDKRVSFNLPTVLGTAAAVAASELLLGPALTGLLLIGNQLRLMHQLNSLPESEVKERLELMKNGISKSYHSAKEIIGKTINSGFDQMCKKIGLDSDNLKTGAAELASQIGTAAQAGASAAADAAQTLYWESGTVFEKIKTRLTEITQMPETDATSDQETSPYRYSADTYTVYLSEDEVDQLLAPSQSSMYNRW